MCFRNRLIATCFLLFIAFTLLAQTDSIRRIGPSTGPRPYTSVITPKAITKTGLFIIHKIDDKYFFEIPENLLGRDLLIVSRISKSAADLRTQMFGYAGDEI